MGDKKPAFQSLDRGEFGRFSHYENNSGGDPERIDIYYWPAGWKGMIFGKKSIIGVPRTALSEPIQVAGNDEKFVFLLEGPNKSAELSRKLGLNIAKTITDMQQELRRQTVEKEIKEDLLNAGKDVVSEAKKLKEVGDLLGTGKKTFPVLKNKSDLDDLL